MSAERRVNSKIYNMILSKKEDLNQIDEHKNDGQVEYTVFGYFDYMSLKETNEVSDMFFVPNKDSVGTSVKGDTLVHNLSLFTCDDDKSTPFINVDESGNEIRNSGRISNSFVDDVMRKNLSLVCMIKLDERILSNKHEKLSSGNSDVCISGIDILCLAKESIESVINEKFPSVKLKVFFSLSTYDLIVFLSAENPEKIANAIVFAKSKCPEIIFSTSFFVFDYGQYKNWSEFKSANEKKYSSSSTGLRIRVCLREYIKISMLESVIKEKLNIVDDNRLSIGYIPGDEDVAITVKGVNCFNVLSLYHPYDDIEKKSLIKDSRNDNFIKNKVRRLYSTFGYFKCTEIENTKTSQSVFSSISNNEKKERIEALEALQVKVKNLYTELSKLDSDNFPVVSRFYIENTLANCSYLIELGNYQGTAFVYLNLLEKGLSKHLKYVELIKGGTLKQSYDISPLLAFTCDLSYSLDTLIDSSNMYMNKIVDLYPMNSYSKLLFAYRNIVSEVYNILPLRVDGESIGLDVFLTIGKTMKIKGDQYFYFPNEYEQYSKLASINMPSPFFFDMSKSYYNILHEVAHMQYTNSHFRLNYALRDMVLIYLSDLIRVIHKNNTGTDCGIDSIFSKLSNSRSILSLNKKNNKETKRTRMVCYVNDLAEAIVEMKEDVLECLGSKAIEDKDLLLLTTEGNTVYINAYRNCLTEARADILMLNMAGNNDNFSEYMQLWIEDSANYDVDRFCGEKAKDNFSLRCVLILAYFDNIKKIDFNSEEIRQIKSKHKSFNYLLDLYERDKLLALPFIKYVKYINATCFNPAACVQITTVWGKYVSNTKRLHKILGAREQLEFYINHWFKDLLNTAHDIENLVNEHLKNKK